MPESQLVTQLKSGFPPEQELISFHQDVIAWVIEFGLETLEDVFKVLRDERIHFNNRSNACYVIQLLHKNIDKRQAVPALLFALKSDLQSLRMTAAFTLGLLGARRATLPLMNVATDPLATLMERVNAVHSLSMIGDSRVVPTFVQLIHDKDAPITVRAQALENTVDLKYDYDWQPTYLEMLSHHSPDLRFWAAYGFSRIAQNSDYTRAIEKLDEIVAYDHTVPVYWGWHIDREAIYPLEQFWYRPYARYENGYYFIPTTYLISPAAEYDTFISEYRQYSESLVYLNKPMSTVELQIDPAWLRHELEAVYPSIRFNLRQSQAYLLDWMLTLEGQTLVGALHRDRYALVVTGAQPQVHQFANWYHNIVDHPLFLYEWAGPGVQLPLKIEANS